MNTRSLKVSTNARLGRVELHLAKLPADVKFKAEVVLTGGKLSASKVEHKIRKHCTSPIVNQACV